jgi:hypothetical protein
MNGRAGGGEEERREVYLNPIHIFRWRYIYKLYKEAKRLFFSFYFTSLSRMSWHINMLNGSLLSVHLTVYISKQTSNFISLPPSSLSPHNDCISRIAKRNAKRSLTGVASERASASAASLSFSLSLPHFFTHIFNCRQWITRRTC